MIDTAKINGILYEAFKPPFRIDADWLERVMDRISLVDPELVIMLKQKAVDIKNELIAKRKENYDAS